jgi:hypothetical protein
LLNWHPSGKAAVSQAGFVRLNATCPSLQGMQVTIVSVQIDGDIAFARDQEGKLVGSYTLAYKHGEWLMEPTDTSFADYRQGVDATIALRKAEGRC